MSARPETENEVALFERLRRDLQDALRTNNTLGMVEAGDGLIRLTEETQSPVLKILIVSFINAQTANKPEA